MHLIVATVAYPFTLAAILALIAFSAIVASDTRRFGWPHTRRTLFDMKREPLPAGLMAFAFYATCYLLVQLFALALSLIHA